MNGKKRKHEIILKNWSLLNGSPRPSKGRHARHSAPWSSHEGATLAHCLGKGAAVDILELATDGNTPGDTTDGNTFALQELGEVMRRRLTFIGVIGGQNHFAYHAVARPREEAFELEFPRADTVEWRYPAHEDVVQAVVGMRLLHHVHVNRRFHDAQLRRITFR